MVNILWIEDQPFWAKPTCDALIDEGHSVTIVSDTNKIPEILSDHFDLVFLDIMMPDHAQEFNPTLTNGGKKTGLLIWKKYLRDRFFPYSIFVITNLKESTNAYNEVNSEFEKVGIKVFNKPLSISFILDKVDEYIIKHLQ